MKGLAGVVAIGVLAVSVGVWAQSGSAQRGAQVPPGDWPMINREPAATRFSPLTQITATNVASLKEAWTYRLSGGATSVPLVVGGVMYVANGNTVVALDADSGTPVWSYALQPVAQPPAPVTDAQGPAGATPSPASPPPGLPAAGGGRRGGGSPPGPTASARGVGYWPGDGKLPARILFMSGNRLIALDAASGAAADGFGTMGAVTVGVPYGGTPTIYRNVAIIGAATGETPQGPAGNPRAFDVVTGKKLWEFQTVPKPGQKYNDTWGDGWKDRSGANMWAFAAPVDLERGIVYLPIAGPATNYYGGDRPGINAFANSIVAVEAQTGKYLWHFQTVHHDIWDIDMPSAGSLFDFVQNGRRTPAIAHVGKSSYVFVLDRVTGKPLIPVEERPVPKGDVPTEWYSPTQPFPARPGPLSRVSFNKDTDLVRPEDTSAAHVAACTAMMDKAGGYYNVGPFTPFLFKETGAPPKSTIQFPGGTGGVNWGGMALDPTTGVFFVNAQNTSLVGWTERKPPGVTYSFEAPNSNHPFDRASVNGVGPFFTFSAPLSGQYNERGQPVGPSLPCQRPPWSKLIAVNANTGQIVWESVLGVNASLPEGKQLVGNSGSAGPTVTAGGLVFVGATNDRRFRAFDAKTGKELWATTVGANANANPMSYLGKSGKQHVAVVAGNTLMVYALPSR
ncbi:MAG TPA: PQQ-binding-like beta-propeller repeat protein [Vicinamibacterales bacterium]|nr:PQQ-binding-like beta-propeller repeat protein [Vicinamibacterales bacterium]